ncbi:MAG: amidohydrolase family protein [Cyclobacteriaceae bacterium]|nr:amidohydrolase family protein [Cyclobacteriaceae bacterium]
MKETTIIQGEFLWDGINEEVIPGGAVCIGNGKIQAVGTADEILRFPHNRELEFPGSTLMPGLIDSHTHLSMDAGLDNYLDHMSDPVAVLTLRAAAMMRKDLQSGVTTCRCCGDREFLDIACRNAVQHGEIPGPHLQVATRGIRAPHGHGFVGYPFEGTGQIRKAIRENAAAGADFIKIYITGTLRGERDLPSYLSYEEIKAAVEESHEAGLQITAHCVGGDGLDWALELGLDCLEHVYHIDDRQIEAFASSATRLVLTPGPMLSDERIKLLPEALIPGHIREKEEIRARMKAVIASGKFFAVGTDGNHGELFREVFYLVEMGATPLMALKAATLHGAIIGGIDKKTGSLEPGKEADLIIIEGNPLRDLSALKRIRSVWKSGRQQYVDR